MDGIFAHYSRIIFSRWTALGLARDQLWADEFTEEVITNFVEDAIQFLLQEGASLYVDVLSNNFERFFDEQFNVDIEDNSQVEVAQNLLRLYREIFQENRIDINNTDNYVSKLAQLPISSNANGCLRVKQGSEDSDDSSDEENCDYDFGDGVVARPESQTPSQALSKAGPLYDEDGFEIVQSRRRR